MSGLLDLRAERDRLDANEVRGVLASSAFAGLDVAGVARIGATWRLQLDALAKSEPRAAGQLAGELLAMLVGHQLTTPASLDAALDLAESPRTSSASKASR